MNKDGTLKYSEDAAAKGSGKARPPGLSLFRRRFPRLLSTFFVEILIHALKQANKIFPFSEIRTFPIARRPAPDVAPKVPRPENPAVVRQFSPIVLAVEVVLRKVPAIPASTPHGFFFLRNKIFLRSVVRLLILTLNRN